MAREDVRSELETVKVGAKDYADKVKQIAGDERYTSLPARALEVAELATRMATLLEGIFVDAADFNFKVGQLTHATSERLGQVAARAMAGANDADARYYITQGARSLNSARYELEYYDDGRGLRGSDAIEIARRAERLAAHLKADQHDIETVAPGYAAQLTTAIDDYMQKL